jgi:hypothetical protein
MMRCIPHPILSLCAAALLLVIGAPDVQAQSAEDSNGCIGTRDNPCVRTGQCAIQGSVWGQRVTIDRADTFDTIGWPGLCDLVHVGLVQGNCSPPGGDRDITVTLSATSYAVVDSITGPLRCAGATTNAAVGATRTGMRLTADPSPSSTVSTIDASSPAPRRSTSASIRSRAASCGASSDPDRRGHIAGQDLG